MIGAAILFSAVMAFGFRIWPRLRQPEFGVDSWYYLNYARAARKGPFRPVELPQYLLDDPEQVYPPLFPRALALLPKGLRERFHWVISPLIDGLHAALLSGAVAAGTGSWLGAALAGGLFATSPVGVAQSTDLNVRPAANLLFTIFMWGLLIFWLQPGWIGGGIALGAGIAIFWTHKMTTQQMTAMLLGLAGLTGSPLWIGLGVGIFAGAWAVHPAGFRKLMRGHREIVAFWRTHRPFLNAHPLYDSPLYRDPAKKRELAGVQGIRSARWSRFLAVGHLIVIAGLLAGMMTGRLPQSGIHPDTGAGADQPFFLAWSGLVFLTAAATQWIPGCRWFGEGFKYLRYGLFPWFLLLGTWAGTAAQTAGNFLPAWICLGLAAAQTAVSLQAIRGQKWNRMAVVDPEIRLIFEKIQERPEKRWLCLPVTRSEALAHFTDKAVLWGAHGTGWDRLAPFFPVFRKPVEDFLRTYRINGLLLDRRYAAIEDLRLPAGTVERLFQSGPHEAWRVL
ncbi:MAG: hypothetical protein COV76_01550 [Candidatus Omnitrophica bacterium CG11_big_fil_rev_8_21_14_0_20_64_10]|nr:MAG: hypothetical protein COV76_01550 [Candidatus Omnitrophica bacterium CG11_big_fil_rev_8_21_14_0_20_64_10]